MNSEILKLIDDELIFKKRRLRNMLCSLAVPVSGGGRNMISYEGSNYYPVNYWCIPEGIDENDLYNIKLAFVIIQVACVNFARFIPCNLKGSPDDLLWISSMYISLKIIDSSMLLFSRHLANIIELLIPDAVSSYKFERSQLKNIDASRAFTDEVKVSIWKIAEKLKSSIEKRNEMV